jgi:hypothetical protein
MYLSGEKLFAYNSMQITINNFLTFMRDKQNFSISQEQEQEIKDNFFKPAQCLVYWSFINEDNDRVYNGTITKEFYIYIRTINPYDCYVIDCICIFIMILFNINIIACIPIWLSSNYPNICFWKTINDRPNRVS